MHRNPIFKSRIKPCILKIEDTLKSKELNLHLIFVQIYHRFMEGVLIRHNKFNMFSIRIEKAKVEIRKLEIVKVENPRVEIGKTTI